MGAANPIARTAHSGVSAFLAADVAHHRQLAAAVKPFRSIDVHPERGVRIAAAVKYEAGRVMHVTSFRVMTFNINGAAYPRDGPNAWANRANLNVATILKHAPDLIGFQEVHEVNLATYRAGLPGYAHVVGNKYGDNPPEESTSIFWKEQRFTLVEAGEFWLSRTPDVPSSDW